MDVEKLADDIMKGAYKNAQREELTPCFFLFDPAEAMTAMMVPHFAREKDAHTAMLRFEIEKMQADFFLVVMEAWMGTPTKEEDKPGYRPMHDPKRISAIVLTGKHRDGREVFRITKIIEPKNGKYSERKFEPQDTSKAGHMLSRFDNMFGELGKPS
jgi:hypothetical protein